MKTGAVFLLAFAFAACSGSSSSNNPTSPPVTGNSNVSFQNQVQPIFTASCATSGCHAGPTSQRGLDLSNGKAYASIVNVKSAEVPAYYRVMPLHSDSSYLYFKITGNSVAGARMPYQRPPLPDTLIQTIRLWIDQGAQNN